MADFTVARSLAMFLAVMGWVVIGLAAIAAVLSVREVGPVALVAGLIGAGMGFVLVASGQLLIAQIVTAESVQALLSIARDGGSVPTRSAFKQGPTQSAERESTAAIKPKVVKPFDRNWSRFDTFEGAVIEQHVKGGYRVENMEFDTLSDAKRWIRRRS